MPDLSWGALQCRDAQDQIPRISTIADVLGMTVDAAWEFFADEPHLHRA